MAQYRVLPSNVFGLAPDEALGEMLFGLIMVLTFTLGAGIASGDDPSEARELILGAMTCNIAWGVIDAVFYIMGVQYGRRSKVRLLDSFAETPDKDAAMSLLREALEDQLATIANAADREDLYDRVYMALRKGTTANIAIERRDFIGAIGVFLLVSLTAVPAAIPFLFVSDPWQALRLSNALLLGVIFLVGYRWAELTDGNPWKSGLGLLILATALVAIAIALGG